MNAAEKRNDVKQMIILYSLFSCSRHALVLQRAIFFLMLVKEECVWLTAEYFMKRQSNLFTVDIFVIKNIYIFCILQSNELLKHIFVKWPQHFYDYNIPCSPI